MSSEVDPHGDVPAARAEDARRRPALWRLGVAGGVGRGGQLSLPLALPGAPQLPALDAWQAAVADYATTGMTLSAHPMALMRTELDGLATSADLRRLRDGSRLRIAGLVVARQRPATARGVVFMLLEDEHGCVNVVVLPPVYANCRLAVRTAAYAVVTGSLERRDGVINVVASQVAVLATPDAPLANVQPIQPPLEADAGRDAHLRERERRLAAAGGAGALAAVAPRAHSFGRRG